MGIFRYLTIISAVLLTMFANAATEQQLQKYLKQYTPYVMRYDASHLNAEDKEV
jgi:hypothetical protein